MNNIAESGPDFLSQEQRRSKKETICIRARREQRNINTGGKPMHARVYTSALSGLEAALVEVQVRLRKGKPGSQIIGLADSSVRESSDRVREALSVCGFRLPDRVLISLAPAEIKKEGSGFDLPIAIALLCATGQIQAKYLEQVSMVGELALDATLRPVRGIVAHALGAAARAREYLVVPASQAREASLVSEIQIVPARNLIEVIDFIQKGEIHEISESVETGLSEEKQMWEVRGQQQAQRAAEIAVAGAHNLLMIGPPGCGKSMIAERLNGILPPLTRSEILEIAQIYSIHGLSIQGLMRGLRPFRAPHHMVSEVGLCGGGAREIRAGEVSFAHNGVLFLDEFPEFRRASLEALRTPIENGFVQVTRSQGTRRFPANFQLIAAMNPCPCGRLSSGRGSCDCSTQDVKRYLKKLSQPILERIDLHVELSAVRLEQLAKPTSNSEKEAKISNEDLRRRINAVRQRQLSRDGVLASRLELKSLSDSDRCNSKALKLLQDLAHNARFSARSFVRILRVAQTIADLAEEKCIDQNHVAEAVRLRALDKLQNYVAAL